MKLLKTTTLVLFALLIANTANAQRTGITKKEKKALYQQQVSNTNNRAAGFYTFSYSTGTFTPLTGATSVNQGQLWDDPTDFIPIGFNFTLFNQTIDTLDFWYGWGGSLSDIAWTYVIAPFDLDLIDRGDLTGTSVSPISYKVEGNVGNRIFKMEWLNAGSYDEVDSFGILNDSVNFQMWLDEGTNDVEYHFGSTSFDNTYAIYGAPGGIIGLYDDAYTDFYLLNNSSSSPAMTGDMNNPFITGNPPSGIIYKFTHNAVSGINEKNNLYNVSFYPNPTTGFSKIKISGNKAENADIIITDILGKEVKKYEKIENNEVIINCEEFSSGIYFYQLKQDNTVLSTGKFVKE